MIGASEAMLIGALLFVLLGLVALRSALSSQEGLSAIGSVGSLEELCPPDFVARLFSDDDAKFVDGLYAPEILNMLRKERRILAMQWIEQTRAHIRCIMREHKEVARHSQDLAVRTELSLAGQHVRLALICHVLAIAIQLLDPPRLRALAVHADLFFHRLAQAQRAVDAAVRGREEMRSAGPA